MCQTFLFFIFVSFCHWRIIALQCCVDFCHTTTWLIHMYEYIHISPLSWGFLSDTSGKEPTGQWRKSRRWGFKACISKIPWKKKQQPSPVFLPGWSIGQRCLVGYSPWGQKELDTIEWLSTQQTVASMVVQTVKNLPAMQETWVQSLGQEDPLEKQMATHALVFLPGRL